MERAPTTAVSISRLVAAVTLAVTLLAMPAFNPEDASARRMSEQTAAKRCRAAGGSIHYEFMDADAPTIYNLSCSLPSGTTFTCHSTGGPFGDIVSCP